MAEVAVLISLFAVGLKLGLPLSNQGWRPPVRLATISMTLTVALIAAIGVMGLGLSLGAAILLGAVLAPTDPVLASDVQVEETNDHDRLRFSLTGKALNNGAAFAFVMLGLGLLGLHDLGAQGWRWFAIDVLWATAGGLGIGGALGALIGRLVVYLRSRHQESVGLDEFLALGLIALTYGLAVLGHTYGFLAVFAAGLALRRVKEQPGEGSHSAARETGLQSRQAHAALATHSEYASAYMMQEVQGFNERLERIAEVAVVLVVGAMLPSSISRPCRRVPLAVISGGTPPIGRVWLARRTRIARSAHPHLLVRHPRNQLNLLFAVRDQSGSAPRFRRGDHHPHPDHGGRLHRAPRDIGDPLDESLCAKEGKTFQPLTLHYVCYSTDAASGVMVIFACSNTGESVGNES